MMSYDRRFVTQITDDLERQTLTKEKIKTFKYSDSTKSLFRLFIAIMVFVVIVLSIAK